MVIWVLFRGTLGGDYLTFLSYYGNMVNGIICGIAMGRLFVRGYRFLAVSVSLSVSAGHSEHGI